RAIDVEQAPAAAVSDVASAEEGARIGTANGLVVSERASANDDGPAVAIEQATAVAEGDVIIPRGARRAAAVAADRLVVCEGCIFDGDRAVSVPDGAAHAPSDELKALSSIDDSAVAADGLVAEERTLPDEGGGARVVIDSAAKTAPASVAAPGLVADERAAGDDEVAGESIRDG